MDKSGPLFTESCVSKPRFHLSTSRQLTWRTLEIWSFGRNGVMPRVCPQKGVLIITEKVPLMVSGSFTAALFYVLLKYCTTVRLNKSLAAAMLRET